MLIDRPQIVEGSSIINASVPTGTSDPSSPNLGELFFRTDLNKLRVYDSTGWVPASQQTSLQNVTSASVTIANADAVLGKCVLVTLPVGVAFEGKVRVTASRPTDAASSNARVVMEYDIQRGGPATGTNAVFRISYGVMDNNVLNTASWYFDTSTGTPYFRFGQSVNSWTYNVTVTLTTSSAVAIAMDSGTAPSGTLQTPTFEFRTQGVHGVSAGLAFLTAGVERARIDTTGYFGIGTASPSYPLDVAGQIRSSTGGFVFPDGSVQTTAASSSAPTLTLSNGVITSSALVTSTTAANQIVDTFSASTLRSAQYVVQVTSGSSYQCANLSVVHDGTTAYVTEYGNIFTASNLASFDADISGGNVRLLVTPVNAATTIKVVRVAVNV